MIINSKWVVNIVNAKDVNMGKIRPNVVSGGSAIDLGNGLFYMRGRTHKQGGIDIGKNPETGIEVENGEIYDVYKGRVFSAQPILNGISPANALLMGGNPNSIFNAQELWKQANHYNDDGTKFKAGGKEKKSLKDRIRNKLIDVYYNTTFKPAIKKYGIDEVRLRLYDNIHPFGYENAQSRIDYAINKEPLSDIERKNYPYSEKDFYENKLRDDIWRTYLNVDKKYSHYGDGNGHKVIESKYKPTNSNENKKYYTITHDDYNGLYSGGIKGKLVNEVLFGAIKHGENRLSNTLGRYFGNHTISRGMDPKKGDYVSFYDLWDIAPSEKNERTGRKDESRGIGTPIEFYDRIYLNDYFDVKPKIPKDSYYEGYLTPSFISEEKEYGGYTPSQEIIDYIKKTEGFRDKWYKDGNGIDTIGYGFTGDNVKKLFADGITREQADKYFLETLNRRAKILEKDTPNWDKLTQSQKDSLLSYAYNIGPGNYKRSKKLQEALLNEDWDNVANNISIGYNDKRNPGLRKRRDYERELFKRDIKSSFTGDEEKAFRDWYDRYSRSQDLDPNPDAKEHYYDYSTYWKNRTPEQKNDEWKLGNHLPDTYKMPGHPTFSTGSIYSTRKTPGGTWKKVGLGPVYDEQFVDSKYTKNLRKYQNVSFKYGGIHIKPSKRGTFTAAAKRHHMSVQEFARTVLNNRARFSAAMIKKANFARNASKWHKKELGGDMTKQYYITKDNIYSLGGNVRPKAELGIKYMIDENGRIVPVNIPNADINIANLSDRNTILNPAIITDKKPKQYNLSGKVIDTSPITGLAGIKNNNHSFNNNVIVPKTNPNNIVIGPKEGLAGGLSYRPINTVKTNKTGFSISPSTADLIGLGINLTGNLAASLINRSAIKGMRYVDAPIPISAQKLPTEVTIEPQVSSIKENIAGQERLIKDNTADSRVALARRQRVRNQGAQQYQTLYGNKLNTELQLLTADRLNRQGVDAQNVTQYNQWRRGLYDFENRRREMLAENAVAGINNAAEAIAGERGYLARREARKRDLLNMGLIAATSPNAQNVIGSKEFEDFLRKIGYDGKFSLLRKRING